MRGLVAVLALAGAAMAVTAANTSLLFYADDRGSRPVPLHPRAEPRPATTGAADTFQAREYGSEAPVGASADPAPRAVEPPRPRTPRAMPDRGSSEASPRARQDTGAQAAGGSVEPPRPAPVEEPQEVAEDVAGAVAVQETASRQGPAERGEALERAQHRAREAHDKERGKNDPDKKDLGKKDQEKKDKEHGRPVPPAPAGQTDDD